MFPVFYLFCFTQAYVICAPVPAERSNKCGEALNFVTKMAVYQPRRAAIVTILVTVMQDDICEELLGRHKRKKCSTNMAGPRIAYQTTTPLLVARARLFKARLS